MALRRTSNPRRTLRASAQAAVLALAFLTFAGVASATPTVSFKLSAVPIPGFAHTGYILGAGAGARLELKIAGREYFGSPPPIIGARFYAPKGSVVHERGFPACAEETLVNIGPSACPKNSKAGPIGTALGFVTFGGERVEERAELFPFIKPGGGLEYYVYGHTPAIVEAMAKGHFSHLGGIEGWAFEEEEEVPLVATVPGGPYASVSAITGWFGAAIRSHGKPIYLFRVPKTCPKGGFRAKAELIFAENGDPSKPEAVTAFTGKPCPRR